MLNSALRDKPGRAPTAAGWRPACGSTAQNAAGRRRDSRIPAGWPRSRVHERPTRATPRAARSGDSGYTWGTFTIAPQRTVTAQKGRATRPSSRGRLLRARLGARAERPVEGRARRATTSPFVGSASIDLVQNGRRTSTDGPRRTDDRRRGLEHSGQAYQIRPQGEPAEHQAPGAQPADAVDAAHGAQGDSRLARRRRISTGAKSALSKTVSIVDKMATKGIIHRNTAGRYKSRLLVARSKKRSA